MKANKNLKITKKGIDPVKADGDSVKLAKIQKDKSSKRRLSIYDDFADESLDDFNYNLRDEEIDEE